MVAAGEAAPSGHASTSLRKHMSPFAFRKNINTTRIWPRSITWSIIWGWIRALCVEYISFSFSLEDFTPVNQKKKSRVSIKPIELIVLDFFWLRTTPGSEPVGGGDYYRLIAGKSGDHANAILRDSNWTNLRRPCDLTLRGDQSQRRFVTSFF